MDPARAAAARARVLAKQKPLAPPPAQIESPVGGVAPVEPASEIVSGHSSAGRSKTPLRSKSVASKKRKAPSADSSAGKGGSSSGEQSSVKKVKRVSWPEMELADPPSRSGMSYDKVDSLWYRGMDYGAFLREQLIPPFDAERNVDYIMEHGPLRLVKSSAVQIIRSAASILSAVPSLHKIIEEHGARDPEEAERLKKELEAKTAQLESYRKESDELLLKREEETTAEVERIKASAAEAESKLRKEIENADDAAYVMFQKGFDQAVAQIKHFNPAASLDLSKIDRDQDLGDLVKTLDQILEVSEDISPLVD